MHITRIEFAKTLKEMVLKKESMQQIALWIHRVYVSYYDNDTDKSFYEILYSLMMMDAGPEFEYTYEELNDIANRLIAGEDVKL